MNTKDAVLLQQTFATLSCQHPVQEALRAFVGATSAAGTAPVPPLEDAGLDGSWPAALGELASVHRLEQARLLCRASALRRTHTGGPVDPIRTGSSMKEWRQLCTAELRDCRADGVEADYLVQECLLRTLARWRKASELARAALALGAGDEARIELARAQLAEGSPRAAIEALDELWPKTRNAALRVCALETLAVACERTGDRHSALCHRRAARAVAALSA